MKVTVEDGGPCRKVLRIEVPGDAVAQEYDAVVRSYAGKAKIPGFRPGRTPPQVVEQRFRKSIAEEARDRLLPRAYQDAITAEKIRALQLVEVSRADVVRGEPLTFTVTVDVEPDFALPVYKGIAVERKPAQIADGDVDPVLDGLRERFATYEDVDRAVQAGDFVEIAFEATVEGQPLVERVPANESLGRSASHWVLVGGTAPEVIPGLAEGILGSRAGDVRTVEVRFPGDYHAEPLRGGTAAYSVTVKLVREKRPADDAALLRETERPDLAALRESVREDLRAAREQEEEGRIKDELVRQVCAQVGVELPESVVERERKAAVQQIVNSSMQRGASAEQLAEHREDILRAAGESSRERLKASFVLARIADEEKLTVTAAEVAERLALLAQRYSMPVDRLRAELVKRDPDLDRLRADLRMAKTVQFLYDHAALADSATPTNEAKV